MSLRSPMARALSEGSARSGVSHWVVERVTSIALAPLAIWLVVTLLRLPNDDYASVIAWISAGWNPVWLSLTLLLAAWHSWLGVQVVVEDYVHGALSRTLTLLLSSFAHGLAAASGVYAVLHLAFRGPV